MTARYGRFNPRSDRGKERLPESRGTARGSCAGGRVVTTALTEEDVKRAEARGETAIFALEGFRTDLLAVREEVDALRRALSAEHFMLTSVRILELLVWMATEQRGYNRE